ncbi:hypothetical protein QUF54_06205 [Candidatus Marithioploca araucensis]|uniref:Uncharacterized protein n=1 Tax=Candidatus Marithioploca araucensis TaxID=70273 RepID=A0ABT7VTM9_9GAMM|nr:hypothetical protein [Candidatus Marithioploca araucensis]
MTHKKILTAAIAAALSMGGGIAQAAGNFYAESPGTIGDGIAYEFFNPAADDDVYVKLPENCTTNCFEVKYEFDSAITKLYKEFDVKFTLKNARFVLNNEPELIVTSDGTTEHSVEVSSPVIGADSIHKRVAADEEEIDLADGWYLKLEAFQIEVLEKDFAQSGQQVELTITLSGEKISDTQTITLAKTVAGFSTDIDLTSDSAISKIDVEEVGKAFTSGAVGDITRARLGTLAIDSTNGVTNRAYTATTPSIDSESAKVTNLPVLPDGTKVYIDTANSNCSNSDDNEATLDGTTAEWNSITGLNINSSSNYICIELPEGNAEVIDPSKSPAKLSFTADVEKNEIQASGNLGHIKRNGALCTLYVVTNDGMQDLSNVRLTNLSSKDSRVIGTLRNMQDDIVFADVELAEIPAKGTVRLGSVDLEGHANMDVWTNRGVLTIGGTIPAGMMEAFLLLRKEDASGQGAYPLLNMSLGASGNACE